MVGLQGELLYRLDGFGGTAPSQKQQFLRFERVSCLEEFLHLLNRSRRQPSYVLQIAFEGRAIGHNEHAIVALLLALRRLFDFEHADRFAFQHEPRIGLFWSMSAHRFTEPAGDQPPIVLRCVKLGRFVISAKSSPLLFPLLTRRSTYPGSEFPAW